MKASIELQTQYKLTPSKLADMVYAAGLEPSDAYNSEEVELIEEAIRLDQATTSTGKPKPRKSGSIARSENAKPVRGAVQQVQDVVTSRKRQGSTLGQQAAMAEVQGFTETYTGITQAFYTQLGAVSQAQIEATEGLSVDSDPLDYEAIAASFFDEEALSALPQGLIN